MNLSTRSARSRYWFRQAGTFVWGMTLIFVSACFLAVLLLAPLYLLER